jgi:hypothetical protein
VIEGRFGLVPRLVEGRDSIFEVTADHNLIYTNRNKSSIFPADEEIFEGIEKYVKPLPAGEQKKAKPVEEKPALFCPLPEASIKKTPPAAEGR